MKRRNFLKILPPLGVAPMLLNGLKLKPFANSRIANILSSCAGVQERVLVLIQLKGGNDGLNTLIPIEQYDTYANLRSSMAIPDSGTNGFIPIDNTLASEDQVALHPSMSGIKYLYDKGWATVIQAAGYDSMNQSHFKGTDIWLTGGDSIGQGSLSSGWMGRSLQAFYPEVAGVPTPEMPDPLGIQVGDPNTSLGFHTETEHQNVINISGQDAAGFYSLIQTIGGAPLVNVPDTDQGAEIQYIMDIEQSVNLYASRISQVFSAGSNSISYPNTGLASQLKTVARMIKGGCKTKIYLCQLGGFDTHSTQVAGSDDTTSGPHADLLKQLSDAVKTFCDDLEGLGLADQVVSCTFSEFGRCAKQNGSLGTDHGTLAPMFVFGKTVRAGVKGTNVDLSDLTSDNQFKNKQFDYRQIFGTLLRDWLGANDFVMQESMFDGFDRIKLIERDYMVDEDCYFGGTPTIIDGGFTRPGMKAAPNPASLGLELTLESEIAYPATLSLHSLGGTLAHASSENVRVGLNIFLIDVSRLPNGFYFARLQNRMTGKAEVVKVSVAR